MIKESEFGRVKLMKILSVRAKNVRLQLLYLFKVDLPFLQGDSEMCRMISLSNLERPSWRSLNGMTIIAVF